MLLKLLSVAFLVTTSGLAQDHLLPSIGETRADVLASMGEPFGILVPATASVHPGNQRVEVQRLFPVTFDLYREVLAGMEFQIQVKYADDPTTSRLHPTEKVENITLIPDKNRPFSELVAMLPWYYPLCESGCHMLGSASGYRYSIQIYPLKPTREQIAVAAAAANRFKQGTSEFSFVPCITVSFQERTPVGFRGPLPAFNALQVDDLRVGQCSPDTERFTSRGLYKEMELPPAKFPASAQQPSVPARLPPQV